MGRDYRDFVEKVRAATDIVRLVGDYLPLRRAGRRHVGLCPFHPEKSPSFSVDEEKQLFYCFGCHAGGDAFKFVMLYEKVEFQEAARILGEKAGIELPRAAGAGESGRGRDPDREILLQIHREAAAFFRKALSHPRQGTAARAYVQQRGLCPDTVEALGIGYAPASWDALKSYLLAARHPARLLARSGLFSTREDGSGYYDRFRDRLMFPIHGLSGDVIGFGGRLIGIGDPQSAKYINSSESPIYSKGENLYGLNWSRDAIRRVGKAVVVEGYLDFAALHEAGVTNAVATLGTAFTPGQARLLSRYTNRVTVNYDPDPAGISAARKSLDLLLARGFSVQVLRLEQGLDPDAFIRQRGAEQYRTVLDSAPGCIDFLVEEAARGRDLADPSAQVEALNELLPHVAGLENPAERSGYFKRIAERLALEDGVLLEQVRKTLRSGGRSISRGARDAAGGNGLLAGATQKVSEAESRLVQNLLGCMEARREILPCLSREEIEDLPTALILKAIGDTDAAGEEPTIAAVMSRLPEGSPQDLLTGIAFKPKAPASAAEAAACLATIRKERMIAERRRLQKEIDAAGTAAALEAMFQRKMELSRRIDDLS